MSDRVRPAEVILVVLSSANLASALALVAVCVGMLAPILHELMGWAGLLSVLILLLLLCAASAWTRRRAIEFTGLLPVSLIAFLGWAILSLLWSQYRTATLGGLGYLLVFTGLGIYIALVRDTIQTIRLFGDSLRFILGVSLALEIFSGLLIDEPIRFLGIDGLLGSGGPISGLMGNRNEMGLLAVIGGISFLIEWRTRSVPRGIAIGSLLLAGITLALTTSPIAWGTAAVAIVVMVVLYGIRRLPTEQRRVWEIVALIVAIIAAVVAWSLRRPIVELLNGQGELNFRLDLWHELWAVLQVHIVEGWGWIGGWDTTVSPFLYFSGTSARPVSSALNAYLDVWFQLGLVGLVLFLVLAGLAFVRSWLLAMRQRSVVYTWPAVVLSALLVASLAESGILSEFIWMTLVICCVKASQSLSWRRAFARPLKPELR